MKVLVAYFSAEGTTAKVAKTGSGNYLFYVGSFLIKPGSYFMLGGNERCHKMITKNDSRMFL